MHDTENVKLTLVLPRDLRDAAKRQAKATDITISQYVRRCLRQWVDAGAKSAMDRMTED